MPKHDTHVEHGADASHGCRELLGELSDYLDGTADAALCAEIEIHLAGCDNCRVVVDTLSKTISLYRSLPDTDVPDEVQERLLHVLRLELRTE